jgi:6-methylsalicylate decarboxylase
MTSPNRIDVHQHVLPPRYADWLRDNGIRPGGIDLPEWSPAAALKFMDGHVIATGVLSVSTPRVHLGNDTQARKWARDVNEYTADLVRADPDRFGLFATLTLPDVEGAIAEAEYALDTLHGDGTILLASNAGRYLGDPGFAPLLAYLHHRQAIWTLHEQRPDLTLTVAVPELVDRNWRHRPMYEHVADRLQPILQSLPRVVVTSVPFHLAD